MILSGGRVVTKRADIVLWRGNTTQLDGRALDIIGASTSYSAMYRRQLWVSAAVNKIANATARLPLKVYERSTNGRENARDTPYGELIAKPSTTVDSFTFWVWVRSTLDIQGEAFLGKIRDKGGRPVELVRMNPAFMSYDPDKNRWRYDDNHRQLDNIPRRDFIHFRHFNPDSDRGMSPLEPLRATLENEEGARRANSALWRNGGRPSVFLQTDKVMTDESATRLRLQWDDVHGGVDNWGKAAILEEGLKANVLPVNVEDLQYIEARKLNREEVCAGYDIPPPVLHILDHATYSNITEQMRSMYRDTMGPKLGHLEATLEMELRDGTFGADREPDFDDDLYAEFLMDEVLRGDFEVRATAYSAGINAGWLEPAEVRAMENKPFVEGSNVLLINSTLVPIQRATEPPPAPPEPPALPPAPEQLALPPGPKTLGQDTVRTLMGRMSRVKALGDIDPTVFVAGLADGTGQVLKTLAESVDLGESVEVFKHRLKTLTVPEPSDVAQQPVFISHTVNNVVSGDDVAERLLKSLPEPVTPEPIVVPAPIVNVPPAHITVEAAPLRAMRRTVERDEHGRIVAIVDTPVDA